jgi:hypothetical protein
MSRLIRTVWQGCSIINPKRFFEVQLKDQTAVDGCFALVTQLTTVSAPRVYVQRHNAHKNLFYVVFFILFIW